MKRWVLLFAAFLCFSAVASAQDAPKVEIFGGYSYFHFDAPGLASEEDPPILANLNGGSASVAVNPLKYLGLVADFGGYTSGESSDLGSAHLNISGVPNTFA